MWSGSNTQASITNGWVERSVPIASGRAERTSTSCEKGLAPIGVDGEEIGATRHMGATVIRHGGIIPPMNGAGTRLTLAIPWCVLVFCSLMVFRSNAVKNEENRKEAA